MYRDDSEGSYGRRYNRSAWNGHDDRDDRDASRNQDPFCCRSVQRLGTQKRCTHAATLTSNEMVDINYL